MVTYFVVLSFVRGKKGNLAPDVPLQAHDRGHAQRIFERLAPTKAGVVAFSRTGDPMTGEYDDAVVLASCGQLPAEAEELKIAC